jgi:isopentenyl diphosphate isomerase/L-lactate dehydrogenase-like FMN-dependent dehydrogenase
VNAVSSALIRARSRRASGIINYSDARNRAKRVLPRGLFDYVDGGAEDEITMRRNVDAFQEVSFRPRVGTINPEPNLATSVLGTPISMPVLTAPCGGMRLVHPDGDIGVASAAAKAGTIHVATSASSYSLEEIATRSTSGPKWFQLYRFSSGQLMEDLVHRAQAAGYEAMVVTVDTPVSGNREKDFKNGFTYNMRVNPSNAIRMAPQMAMHPGWVYRFVRDGMPFQMSNTLGPNGEPMLLTAMSHLSQETHSPTWEHVPWIRENWKGPMLIKGILTAEDARRSADAGADGIVVSNHGGRQLEGAPSTIEVLPEIVDAIGDRLEVLLDSGVRRGNDVLRAVALGAKAVLVGRFAMFGLAAGGQAGVEQMLSVIRSDMVRSMRLMGATSVADLDRTWVASHASQRSGGAAS